MKAVPPLRRIAAAAASVAFVLPLSAAHGETITLVTGTGALGSLDPNITFYSPGDNVIGPFTSANFASAQSGPHAVIVGPFTGSIAWSAPLPPGVQWISTTASIPPASALYAYSFNVSSAVIGAASLSMTFAVDNGLGSGAIPGLYLNGNPLPNSVNAGLGGLGFTSDLTYADADIAALLTPGLNTLYFYQYDFGGVAGSFFDATISITPGVSAVPEPGTLGMVLAGLVGLMTFARLRRRHDD